MKIRHHQQTGKRSNPLLDRLLKVSVPPPKREDPCKTEGEGREWLDWAINNLIELCRRKAPLDGFRERLINIHSCQPKRFSVQNTGSRALLTELYSYAAFAPPDDLPDLLTLWRGTSGLDAETAGQGYFWSADYEVACRFALTNATESSANLVLRANVPTKKVSCFGNSRFKGEAEYLLLDPPEVDYVITLPIPDWKLWQETRAAFAAA